MKQTTQPIALTTLLIVAASCCSWGQAQVRIELDIDQPPLHYSDTPPSNRVSRLAERLAAKQVELKYTPTHGYLPALLKALEIPQSSQVLVFSQTSMQIEHISRRNPRAIYFNDDTYLGWIPGSPIIEISTTDPRLGAAFYTVKMSPSRAKLEQRSYDCLGCHATSMTLGVPGHTVRSVHTNYDGRIEAQQPSYVTDETSPFTERWGGWYVTGKHGDMRHLGNSYLRGGVLDTRSNGNLSNLSALFDATEYLTPYSDICALMVLEHQTQMHNVFTRADFTLRQLLHERKSEDKDELQVQCELLAKEVVDRLFFCDEFALTAPVQGSVAFEHAFESRGPADTQGRSLREFDMQRRMFKYPLSYLIYSNAFDELTPSLRTAIARQMHSILSGDNLSEEYAHLDATMRSDILDILAETKPGLFQ